MLTLEWKPAIVLRCGCSDADVLEKNQRIWLPIKLVKIRSEKGNFIKLDMNIFTKSTNQGDSLSPTVYSYTFLENMYAHQL